MSRYPEADPEDTGVRDVARNWVVSQSRGVPPDTPAPDFGSMQLDAALHNKMLGRLKMVKRVKGMHGGQV